MKPHQPKTLVDLAVDEVFLGSAALTGPDWAPWRACLAAVGGLPPENEDAAALIRRCTGLDEPPTTAAREVWALVGRRGGKSRIAAFLAVCLATKRYKFAAGERGTFIVIASDRRQARQCFGYIKGYFEASPMLRAFVARDGNRLRITTESIELTNHVTVEVMTASHRALRGYTVVGAIADEVAFWPMDESSNPDTEVLNALRPAMATVPDAMLIAITSVYAQRGEAWRMFKEHFGKPGDVLVWKATSREMNSTTLPQSVVDMALARDPIAAAAEYLSEFRSDAVSFLVREAVEEVIADGCHERAPVRGVSYVAFVDPAGGSGGDSMTLAIAHEEGGRAVLDLLREHRPPFSPEAATAAFAADLQRFGIGMVTGDRYGGDWVAEAFRAHGINYDKSALSKSEMYQHLLPMVNAAQCVLLDNARLKAQLLILERRTARGGRDSIDHPPRQHDDVANAAAGALHLASRRGGLQFASATVAPEDSSFMADYAREPLHRSSVGTGVPRRRLLQR